MNLSTIILGPVSSEKGMHLSQEHNQTTLFVHTDATKSDITSAVKKFFGVTPKGVRIIKTPTKIRVRSKHGPQVKRKRRKKAIISLSEGESIDLLNIASAKKPKRIRAKKKEETEKTAENSAVKTKVATS